MEFRGNTNKQVAFHPLADVRVYYPPPVKKQELYYSLHDLKVFQILAKIEAVGEKKNVSSRSNGKKVTFHPLVDVREFHVPLVNKEDLYYSARDWEQFRLELQLEMILHQLRDLEMKRIHSTQAGGNIIQNKEIMVMNPKRNCYRVNGFDVVQRKRMKIGSYVASSA